MVETGLLKKWLMLRGYQQAEKQRASLLLKGTPMVIAMVKPTIISPTACVRLAGGTIAAATKASTPKY